MKLTQKDQRILGLYESIGRLSRTMVVAAERADWDGLAAAERICALVIERIEAYGDAAAELGPCGRRRRFEILREVLEDDAAIRRYTEPSLARIDRILSPPAKRGRGG
jgi:flagellar protein FliT